MTEISNEDLLNKQYDIDILISNIEHLNLLTILDTQKLDIDFCVAYILNKKFQSFAEEKNIGLDDIFRSQPHLDKTKFIIKLKLFRNIKLNQSEMKIHLSNN